MRRRWSAVVMVACAVLVAYPAAHAEGIPQEGPADRWRVQLDAAAAEQSNVIRTGVGLTLAHGGPAGQRRTAAAGEYGTYAAPEISAGGVRTPC